MRVEVIGVPSDEGAPLAGARMGPAALRCAGLHRAVRAAGHELADLGDVALPPGPVQAPGPGRLPAVTGACRAVAAAVEASHRRGALPLVLGGDHSLAAGSVLGGRRAGRGAGLIWLDAHGDFNTPGTSPTGNLHGMPLAALVLGGVAGFGEAAGAAVQAGCAVLLGVRSLDAGERCALLRSGLTVLTMEDIERQGICALTARALAVATAGGRRPFHLSWDLDVLDPEIAPGVGTPVPGGLTFREARCALEGMAASGLLCALDVVELNPALDVRNRTAELAVELIGAVLQRCAV